MKTSVRFAGVALSMLWASCAQVEEIDGHDDGTERGSGAAVTNSAWVEALAPTADPCAGASPHTCEGSTRGACGAVTVAEGDLCLPRFPWGVLPDGTVELASSERTFRIADLEAAPLSEREEEEARAFVAELAAATPLDEGATEAEAGPEPIAINHTGWCSTSAQICVSGSPFVTYYTFSSHYNYKDAYGVYRHRHVLRNYELGTRCGPTGVWGYVYRDCGTP